MCKSCRVGNALTNRGRDQLAKDRPELAARSFQASEQFHDECSGCECDHVTGPAS